MAKCVRFLLLSFFVLLLWQPQLHADDSRFDLIGPRIDVRVTRNGVTLPIAQVPNLMPGDRLWLHPDLPADQSAHYLLICAFLRGSTNPPPDSWFTRIQTWDRKVREEGAFVIVPKDAQQAVLFMAPETGGDFSTLRKAVEGRPGIFVRASQDLTEAGFEQARIEKYLALIRRVPPSDPAELLKRSNLLARTLALKPNSDCFKQPVDTQFTCLTQSGSQTLLDDSHAQSVVSALSNGPNSDFINEASYTSLAAGGLYSAYVGAVVDLVRIMGNLHTAQYQYIPAIAFPEAEALNLRLNSPPSFRNPKSVIVIGLPSVHKSVPPPLRPADANFVSCLLKPSVTLPIEGAPLVFSTGFAHSLVLHFNVPPGSPAEPDVPLVADAFQGGLVLQQAQQHHTELPMPAPLPMESSAFANSQLAPKPGPYVKPQPKPILLTGTVEGKWGFDPFIGPTLQLQQLPGGNWHIVTDTDASTDAALTNNLIAGHTQTLTITSTGSACVHTITAHPTGSVADLPIAFKSAGQTGHINRLTLTLPLEHDITPGDLHLAIQQYGQPRANVLSARTFAEPAHITSIEIHAADRSILLRGVNLSEIDSIALGDLVFKPSDTAAANGISLDLPSTAPVPPTRDGERLTAIVTLHDGRTLTLPVVVAAARPSITLIGKTVHTAENRVISLPDSSDLPLNEQLTFTTKSATRFPRNGQIEIETVDGTLRTVLTLAPSGGLLLQDPHTIVATLDPESSFGPSAFGPLQLRAVYPPKPTRDRHGDEDDAHAKTSTEQPTADLPTSDWIPLATLVRLPTLTLLQCPTDPNQNCTLTGTNLFLLKSISIDPTFSNPIAVPDGFTGSTLSIPQPVGDIIYVHLRDDPGPIDPAHVPMPPPPPPPVHKHEHTAKSKTLPPVKVIPIPGPATTVPSATTAPSGTPSPAPASSSTPPPTNTPDAPSSTTPQ
jgi:hypothetical protein